MSYLFEQLKQHMLQNGLPCHQEIFGDGHLRRYCKNGSRKEDEYYVGTEYKPGKYSFVYGSHSDPEEKQYFWNNYGGRELTPEEKQELQQAQSFNKLKFEQERRDRQKAAESQAKTLWNEYIPATPDHPYLDRKKIPPNGCKVDEKGALVVPMRDIEGNLLTFEYVHLNGSKTRLPGGNARDSFFTLGDIESSKSIAFCEGFSTGSACFLAKNIPVVCTMGINKIVRLALLFKDKYPHKDFILYADLDKPGQKLCSEMIETWNSQIKGVVYQPQLSEEFKQKGYKDFNDVLCLPELGIDSLKSQLQPKQFPSLNLGNFLVRPMQPQNWIFDRWLLEGSYNWLVGEPGVGKSYKTLEAALMAASGNPFLKFACPQKRKTLYIEGEMGDMSLKVMIEKIMSRYLNVKNELNIKIDDNDFNIVTKALIYENNQPPINIYDASHRMLLNPLIADSEFIILDNLTALSDCIDENASSTWAPVHQWLNLWTIQGKTFLILHHPGRNGLPRGTTTLSTQASSCVKLEKDPEAENFGFKWHFTKLRGDLEPADWRSFRVIDAVERYKAKLAPTPWDCVDLKDKLPKQGKSIGEDYF